ncbi:putative F-box domain-containing protein [Helianthus annuus]|nr:putative F-box domain-containing protein [Helianthus annuus]KAJ0886234.1 putative F-box domain-containing protein [Helianthus annuus]
MSNLPHDILIDILSRLPAKSLGQFKSVSKHWSSLISSPSFIKLHHRRALSDTNTNHSRVLIMSTHSLHSVNYESPSCYEGIDDDDDNNNNNSNAMISLKDPLEKESVGEKALGSCYGLVFFVCYNDVILLWNPTTQKTRLIPDPITPFSNATRFYGLGYDFSIDDYKMVRASHSISSDTITSQVFSLKTGSWRTIQTAHMNINDPDEIGSFSNGAIHWIVRHNGGLNNSETILSFNVKDERFLEIRLPNSDESENEESGFWSVGDLKGCLYVVYGGDGVDMDVWVMKEYGVEGSWNKVIKLDWVRFSCDYGMMPVCFTHEDDVVIDLDSWDLVRFNIKENTYKRFKKCSTDWHFWVVYTETLVSPYG